MYRQRGSDKEAQELSKALTPGQLPLLEDPEVLQGDESLSRCRGLYPHDLSAFSVSTKGSGANRNSTEMYGLLAQKNDRITPLWKTKGTNADPNFNV